MDNYTVTVTINVYARNLSEALEVAHTAIGEHDADLKAQRKLQGLYLVDAKVEKAKSRK